MRFDKYLRKILGRASEKTLKPSKCSSLGELFLFIFWVSSYAVAIVFGSTAQFRFMFPQQKERH